MLSKYSLIRLPNYFGSLSLKSLIKGNICSKGLRFENLIHTETRDLGNSYFEAYKRYGLNKSSMRKGSSVCTL